MSFSYTCPFVEKFSIDIETYYKPDTGNQNNVFNLSSAEKRQRDIGKDGFWWLFLRFPWSTCTLIWLPTHVQCVCMSFVHTCASTQFKLHRLSRQGQGRHQHTICIHVLNMHNVRTPIFARAYTAKVWGTLIEIHSSSCALGKADESTFSFLTLWRNACVCRFPLLLPCGLTACSSVVRFFFFLFFPNADQAFG